jgi:hypothetical protein
MGVDPNHEEEREVMSVPESLETLVANLFVGGRVHQYHDQEHEMTSYASRLRVVNLESNLFPNLSALNVEKVYVVGGSMNHGPESHGIGNLSVEPDVFIGREQPLQLGPEYAKNISKHWEEDQTTVEGKNETCTTGDPHGPSQTIESSELFVVSLTVPPITKEEEVKTIEDNVEG